MTVSPYEPPPGGGEVVQYRPEGRSVTMLRDWAEAARAAFSVAQSLVKTTFVPIQYRHKPDEATAAILAGFELGFDPIASLNAFYPIQGRSAPYALTLRAVVQSHGHEIETVETTGARCVMRGRRAGAEKWQTVTWTIQRARDLGLTTREQWRKQPQNMLIARATAELCRLIAADAIMGIPYSAEELRDQGDAEPAANGARPTRARRQTPVAIAPADPPSAPAEPPTTAGPPPLPGEPWTDDRAAQGEAAKARDAELALADAIAEAAGDQQAIAEAEHEAAEAAEADDAPEDADEQHEADEAAASNAGDEPADDDDTEPAADEPAERPATDDDHQTRMREVFARLREARAKGVDVGDRHAYASGVLKRPPDRPVTTYAELSTDDLRALIANLRDLIDDK